MGRVGLGDACTQARLHYDDKIVLRHETKTATQLAQLVEHQTVVRELMGSIPITNN